jgi:hypothetical protein
MNLGNFYANAQLNDEMILAINHQADLKAVKEELVEIGFKTSPITQHIHLSQNCFANTTRQHVMNQLQN